MLAGSKRSYLAFLLGFAGAAFLWTFFQANEIADTTHQPVWVSVNLQNTAPDEHPPHEEPRETVREEASRVPTKAPKDAKKAPVPSPLSMNTLAIIARMNAPPATTLTTLPIPLSDEPCECPVDAIAAYTTKNVRTYLQRKNVAFVGDVDYEEIAAACASNPPGHIEQGIQCCGTDDVPKDPQVTYGESWCNNTPYTKNLASNFLDLADEALRVFSKRMAEAELPWHLAGKTLLAWYLRCKIVDVFDNDYIEIAVMEEDWNTAALKQVFNHSQTKFRWQKCQYYDGISWVWYVNYLGGNYWIPPVKFIIRQVAREKFYSWYSWLENENHLRWDNYNIVPAIHEDIPIGIPENVENYLWLQFKNLHHVCANFPVANRSLNIHLYVPRWDRKTMLITYPPMNVQWCSPEFGGRPPKKTRSLEDPPDFGTSDVIDEEDDKTSPNDLTSVEEPPDSVLSAPR